MRNKVKIAIKEYLFARGNAMIFIALLLAFSCLINWLVSVPIIKRVAQLKYFDDWQYSYVYYTNSQCSNKDNYISADGKLTLHIKAHSEFEHCNCSINCVKIMQLDTCEYSEKLRLNFGEVAISKNTADKYGLRCGDRIYGNADYTSIIIEYRIVEIFGYAYGLNDISFTDDTGVVILGYDGNFINYNAKYVWLSSREEGTYFLSNIGKLVSVHNIENEKTIIKLVVVGFALLAIALINVLYGIYNALVAKPYLLAYRKRLIYGESKNKIKVCLLLLLALPLVVVLAANAFFIGLINMQYGLLVLVPVCMILVQAGVVLLFYFLYFKKSLKL